MQCLPELALSIGTPVVDKMDYIQWRQQGCEKCPRLVSTRRRILFGQGKIPADIMIVGDFSRIYQEDNIGMPLPERTLDDWLAVAGLNRKSVFVTLLTKCTPGWNARPTKKEQQECAPYFEDELMLVRPKFILCMGAAAFNFFVPKVKKGKVTYNKYTNRLFKRHEVEHNGQKFIVIPVVSPAYAWVSDKVSAGRKMIETLIEIRAELE